MGRKRGSRFRKAIDILEQLEGIEHAQQVARKGKSRKKIDRITKSKKRLANRLDRIAKPEDVREEFA